MLQISFNFELNIKESFYFKVQVSLVTLPTYLKNLVLLDNCLGSKNDLIFTFSPHNIETPANVCKTDLHFKFKLIHA